MNFKYIGAIALTAALTACAGEIEIDGQTPGEEVDGNSNSSPVAQINALSGTSPLIVRLDASASSDLDNDLLSYEWIIDLGEEEIRLSSSLENFAFPEAGVYQITLVVTDSRGAQGSVTIALSVGSEGTSGGDDGASNTGGDDGTSNTTGGNEGGVDGGGTDDGASDDSGDDGTSDTTGGDEGGVDGGGTDDGTSDDGGDDGTSDTTGGDEGGIDGGGTDDGTSGDGGDDGTSDTTGGDEGGADDGGTDDDTGGDDGGTDGGATGDNIDALLSYAVNNIIVPDLLIAPGCGFCHTPGNVIAGSTNFLIGSLDEPGLEQALTDYIALEGGGAQRLKDKPTGVIIHGPGDRFYDFEEEYESWEALVDALDERVNGEIPGQDPKAEFNVSVTGLNVSVDASETIEASENPHIYEWTTSNNDRATGQAAEFSFPSDGSYTISLTVTDSSTARVGTTQQTVMVVSTSIGSAACNDSNDTTCFDFETGIPDALNGQTTGNLSLDTTQGYKSDSSIKVTSNFSSAGFLSIDPPADDFWARVFVKSSGDTAGTSWGGDTQGFTRGHGTLLKGLDGSAQLRVGDHRCQLELNRDRGQGILGDDLEMTSGFYGDDNTVCRTETFGARMKPDTWYCLEVHFNELEYEFQVLWDNQVVEKLHVTQERTWTNADKAPGGAYSANSGQPWGPYNFDSFQFGYENYHGGMSVTHWYDGVAVSEERIGCGDDYIVNGLLDNSTKLTEADNGPYED